ncbi:MAG: DUF3416 domain-containing protein [Chitinivibrionales bacterium]|nr:DUF3416 domain-containing protein [Chitinivibrionales bacterium]
MSGKDGRRRAIIINVTPQIENGRFPVKRIPGEEVVVEADIFSDGHDDIGAVIAYRKDGSKTWNERAMTHIVNDRWRGAFVVRETGLYQYTLYAWVDHFSTWQKALHKKIEAGRDIVIDLQIGLEMIAATAKRIRSSDRKQLLYIEKRIKEEKDTATAASFALSQGTSNIMTRYPDRRFAKGFEKVLRVRVDRKKALFSSWYELFPRSLGPGNTHGTFADCEKTIPEIAKNGFDVLYFPPIHPIGTTHRKGKNNSASCEPGDPGSPWAIGSVEGGHTAIHSQLGTMKDFKNLVRKAHEHGVEIALDIAFQCSPDHPWVHNHPEWFLTRPDGTIQFAENPPKKYEDIVPLNFESENWPELWNELKNVFDFWIDKGIRIFRVDNPHTKSFRFWEWCLQEILAVNPDVIFLSEAFTRPKVMQWLAKIGFTQSYTYFTWRDSKHEFIEYLTELTRTEMGEYFRPNFWPNTPDILARALQYAGRPSFINRLILAATLSSNFGVYGPAFELCVNTPVPEKEEYLNSEKYEIKDWPPRKEDSLAGLMSRLNQIRRENAALQQTRNIEFLRIENDQLICYLKIASGDRSGPMLIAVNLDPHNTQTGWVEVPLEKLDITDNRPFKVYDCISDTAYTWKGRFNYIELNPHIMPAHIFSVHTL